MDGLGKWLVVLGAGIMALGALIWLFQSAFGLKLGRLPGDIAVERDGFSFFFPITSMLLVSAVAALLLWLVSALRR